MRKLILVLLALLMLSGCSQTKQVENQAFAVVMSMDVATGGGLSVGILLPGMNGQSDEYLTATAEGQSFSDAAEGLREFFPRSVNLSHVKLIVASAELAGTDAFSSVLQDMAVNYPLTTAARFVVTDGSAADFVAAQDTTVGSRLSTGITAMFEHYTSMGTVPNVTFGDMIQLMESCYSSPISIFARQSSEEAPPDGKKKEFDAKNSNLYCGTAVFRDNKLALLLDSDETALMCLLRGRNSSFIYDKDGVFAKIASGTPLDVTITKEEIEIQLTIDATLYNCSQEEFAHRLESDIVRLIQKCQVEGCEPFCFAERDARHYPDLQTWQDSAWMERFRRMNVRINVEIRSRSA